MHIIELQVPMAPQAAIDLLHNNGGDRNTVLSTHHLPTQGRFVTGFSYHHDQIEIVFNDPSIPSRQRPRLSRGNEHANIEWDNSYDVMPHNSSIADISHALRRYNLRSVRHYTMRVLNGVLTNDIAFRHLCEICHPENLNDVVLVHLTDALLVVHAHSVDDVIGFTPPIRRETINNGNNLNSSRTQITNTSTTNINTVTQQNTSNSSNGNSNNSSSSHTTHHCLHNEDNLVPNIVYRILHNDEPCRFTTDLGPDLPGVRYTYAVQPPRTIFPISSVTSPDHDHDSFNEASSCARIDNGLTHEHNRNSDCNNGSTNHPYINGYSTINNETLQEGPPGFLFEYINQYFAPLKWNTFNSRYVLHKGKYDLLGVSNSIIGKGTDRIVFMIMLHTVWRSTV
jgi:hypothetical protein